MQKLRPPRVALSTGEIVYNKPVQYTGPGMDHGAHAVTDIQQYHGTVPCHSVGISEHMVYGGVGAIVHVTFLLLQASLSAAS